MNEDDMNLVVQDGLLSGAVGAEEVPSRLYRGLVSW